MMTIEYKKALNNIDLIIMLLKYYQINEYIIYHKRLQVFSLD